jgi:peptidoglycan hydrolase-like protein with peptidoglycan-binding domain
MKKSLQEDLKRIHELTYGKSFLNEEEDNGFLSKVLKKVGLKKDDIIGKDPKKADEVGDNVKEFYKNLDDAIAAGGLSQQQHGSMTYQAQVESMQIGLILLGYELPVHGVDGLFGPETASAVKKYKTDKGIKDEVNEAFVQLNDTSYSNVKFDSDGTQYDQVNQALLDDLQAAASKANVVVTITTAKSGHPNLTIGGKESRHSTNTAVDIAILNGVNAGGASNEINGNSQFRELGNSLKSELVNMGYSLNAEGSNQKAVLWQTNTGGNHFNHLHVSNTQGVSGSAPSESMAKATPEFLKSLVDSLEQKGVTSEDLKKHINKIELAGLTDKNFYMKLLESLGAPVSDENMKFMYAWRQAEGNGGKYNPFNTTWNMPGSTTMNSAGVRNYASLEDGMVATIKTLKNGYYNCIVSGLKDDIGASNIARCESLKTWGTGDLVGKVVSSYNSGANPNVASLV